MDLPEDSGGRPVSRGTGGGDNAPPLSVSELSRCAQADDRDVVRQGPRARRDFRLQAPRIGPLLFHPEGRGRLHRRGDLADDGADARVPARGRGRGHRHRQADHLPRPLEIPDRRRADGAGGRGRADGAARQAPPSARRRRAVRRGAQAQAAVPAARDRRRDVADRGRHPRHPASPRGSLPDPCHRLAGAGAGRRRVGQGRAGDPRVSARSSPAERFRARTC